MSFFKKWGASLLAIGTVALTVFTPALQGAISSHPVVSGVLAAIYSVLAHLLPSPVQ